MRAPSPIEYPLCSSGLWHCGVAGLISVVVGVDTLWALGWVGVGPVVAVCCALLAGSVAVVTVLRCRPERPGVLRWDGAHWRFDAYGSMGVRSERSASHLDVMLDLEDWMLLRLHVGSDQPREAVWLPVARRSAPQRWSALRMTVRMASRNSGLGLVLPDGGAR
jgi:hypothetical protein